MVRGCSGICRRSGRAEDFDGAPGGVVANDQLLHEMAKGIGGSGAMVGGAAGREEAASHFRSHVDASLSEARNYGCGGRLGIIILSLFHIRDMFRAWKNDRPSSHLHHPCRSEAAAPLGIALAALKPYVVEAEDDGWPTELDDLPPLRTTIGRDASKSIITTNKSPDISFDRSITPYRGCEHGCVYCFARPTHAWLGLSPGLDFESRLFAKDDAAELLQKELGAKNYEPKLIAIGTNTDPYQPIERKLRIMRDILGVLRDTRHPVTITTKSDAVLRDIDILQDMAAEQLVHVTISVTTLDRAMARTMEPRAASPHRRIAAIRTLAAANIPVAVNVAPIIPGLTDHELEMILSEAADAGAMAARYILLRLPLEVKDLFDEWLTAYHPDRTQQSIVSDQVCPWRQTE